VKSEAVLDCQYNVTINTYYSLSTPPSTSSVIGYLVANFSSDHPHLTSRSYNYDVTARVMMPEPSCVGMLPCLLCLVLVYMLVNATLLVLADRDII